MLKKHDSFPWDVNSEATPEMENAGQLKGLKSTTGRKDLKEITPDTRYLSKTKIHSFEIF